MRAKTFTTCAHPDCHTALRDSNVTGVCTSHIHSKFCQCKQCLGMGRTQWRVRTRAEMVALGLLPERRVFA